MKFRSIALLVFLALFANSCNPPTSAAFTVSGTWTYTFTATGGAVVCPVTNPTTCVKTFNLYDVSNPANRVLIGSVAAPALSISVPSVNLSFGPHLFAYNATGFDANGAATTSADSTDVSIAVSMPAPQNPTVKVM